MNGENAIRGVVMIGAGGHAKVCIELLRATGEQVDYCVGSSTGAATCLGVPVLDGDEHVARLRSEGYDRVFVAIGSARLREKLACHALALGYQLVNAVSPAATVSPSARLGRGVAIMAGAVVNAESQIGDLCIVNTGATVDHDCCLGRAVHIAPQTALAGTVTIGDAAFLGIGCRVIPETAIGAHAIVGAGSVVIHSIPAHATAVGVPARVIKQPSV